MTLDCDEDPGIAGEPFPPDVYEKLVREWLRKFTPKPPIHRKPLPKHLPRQSVAGSRKESEDDYEDTT